MKTNLGIETTDDERLKIGEALGTSHMVTRNELKEAINDYVRSLIDGRDPDQAGRRSDQGAPIADEADPPPHLGADRSLCEFRPSRGDEDYIFKPKDAELKRILSKMLDVSEEYEAYIWRKHHENRA